MDQLNLARLDSDRDGVLTLDEIRDLEARLPLDKDVQDIARQVESDGITGIRYDGRCSGTSQDGIAVQGKDGESVQGKDGESVVGRPGESVVAGGGQSASGKPGTNGASAAGADGKSVQGKDGESVVGRSGSAVVAGEACVENPALALADANKDGVVSIDEIDNIIKLVGGNDELEAVRDQAVDEGITGIRYQGCGASTPVASPQVATPAATPNNATPSAAHGVLVRS